MYTVPRRHVTAVRVLLHRTILPRVGRRAAGGIRRRGWFDSQEGVLLSRRATIFANTMRQVIFPVTLVNTQLGLIGCLSGERKASLSVTLAVSDFALVRPFA